MGDGLEQLFGIAFDVFQNYTEAINNQNQIDLTEEIKKTKLRRLLRMDQELRHNRKKELKKFEKWLKPSESFPEPIIIDV